MSVTFMEPQLHSPVLLKETLEALNLSKGSRIIDGTVGTGGHTYAILEAITPGGQILGIDTDPEALSIAKKRLARFEEAITLVHGNFSTLKGIAELNDFVPVQGILLDLGMSSLQLSSSRGFSFQGASPLDMRFNPEQDISAGDLVNTATENELFRIIHEYGEEPLAKKIVKSIIDHRPITDTGRLVQAIEKVYGNFRGHLHPATKTFQALRIATNQELENLHYFLPQAVNILDKGGRLVVISYHSLEDKIVKTFLSRESRDCVCPPVVIECVCHHSATLKSVNKKVIRPKPEEVFINHRSRSARLRIAEKL